MTQEQYDRLTPYKAKLERARKFDYLNLDKGDFEALHSVYKDMYKTELSKTQQGCGTCRLRMVKQLAEEYRKKEAVDNLIRLKEEEIRESNPDSNIPVVKKKGGRPKKIKFENDI